MPQRRDLISKEHARDLLSEIPNAAAPVRSDSKRSREYEKKHRAFTYRLTDKEIGPKIAAVAESLLVPADDVARAFVEAGINAAQQGQIPFNEIPPVYRHLTLYPTGRETWEIQPESVWPKEIPDRKKRRKLSEVEKKMRQKELNQFRVSYRWPASLDRQLAALVESMVGKSSSRSEGRKGWTLTVLLRYGLKAYESGHLPLKPVASTVKQRLKW